MKQEIKIIYNPNNHIGAYTQIVIEGCVAYFNSVLEDGTTHNVGTGAVEYNKRIPTYTVRYESPEGKVEECDYMEQRDINSLKDRGYKILETKEA